MAKKKILIVEDEADILSLIEWHLQSEGYDTITARDGNKGLSIAVSEHPDLILLDIMLPGMNGLEVCKSLKKNSKTAALPIVMLTAKGEEVDRIVGFELGADDYIVKPFSPRELILRIRAIFRRSEREMTEPSRIIYHDLKVDIESHRVLIGKEEIILTATEFNLLADLLQNKGKVRTRDQLLDSVWGYQFDGYARTVDTHIRRLRQKITPYEDAIETVRGVGYRFREEER